MLVRDLREGMLLKARDEYAIVYSGHKIGNEKMVRSAPDILAPGFDDYEILRGGTWMYLGSIKIPAYAGDYSDSKRKVHELFHSKGGIFITVGQIFKDLRPLEAS